MRSKARGKWSGGSFPCAGPGCFDTMHPMNTAHPPKFTDSWRDTVYRDALAAGVSDEIAAIVAERCGTAADAPKETRTAREISGMTSVVGAPQLALPMIRSRASSDDVAEMLRAALPRTGKDRLRLTAAGIEQAKFAAMAAGIYASRRQA